MKEDKNVIPLSGKSIENLIVIDINKGSSYVSVIFDTGASISVVNKTTAIKFDALDTDRNIRGGGTTGDVSDLNLSTFEGIRIGDYTLPKIDIVVVEDEVLHFGQNEEGKDLIIDGFLGWDIISKLSWEYKHENSELHFEESTRKSYKQCKLDDWDNMPILNVILNGQERVFGFDSGHTESVIGKLLYSEYDHLDTSSDDFIGIDGHSTESVKIADTLELEVINSKVILEKISVVNRNMFPSKRNDICGLLGIDIVEGRSWILDYQNRYFEIF